MLLKNFLLAFSTSDIKRIKKKILAKNFYDTPEQKTIWSLCNSAAYPGTLSHKFTCSFANVLSGNISKTCLPIYVLHILSSLKLSGWTCTLTYSRSSTPSPLMYYSTTVFLYSLFFSFKIFFSFSFISFSLLMQV